MRVPARAMASPSPSAGGVRRANRLRMRRREVGWSDRADALVERVARGAHRAHEVFVAAFVERFAQAADMDIDGAELDLGIAAPDGIEQLLAREHTAGPLEEESQQAEFGRPEMNRLAGAADAMRREIEREIAEAQHLGIRGRPGTADHG